VATMMCDAMRALLVAAGIEAGAMDAAIIDWVGVGGRHGGMGRGERGGRRHACMRAVAPLIGERGGQ
jgi:hypothetical protein